MDVEDGEIQSSDDGTTGEITEDESSSISVNRKVTQQKSKRMLLSNEERINRLYNLFADDEDEPGIQESNSTVTTSRNGKNTFTISLAFNLLLEKIENYQRRIYVSPNSIYYLSNFLFDSIYLHILFYEPMVPLA